MKTVNQRIAEEIARWDPACSYCVNGRDPNCTRCGGAELVPELLEKIASMEKREARASELTVEVEMRYLDLEYAVERHLKSGTDLKAALDELRIAKQERDRAQMAAAEVFPDEE